MVKRICGIFVFGLTSSFFLMSSGLPVKRNGACSRVFHYVWFSGNHQAESSSVTWLVVFFLLLNLGVDIKKQFFLSQSSSPLRSACKLLRLIETVTPETEYCGFTADSSLYFISAIFIFNFCISNL